MEDYLSELENCELCEWRCGANRLEGELGVCRMGEPQIASAMLHPAPPRSYTIFLSGCNFKCLDCQNWRIAHYPDSGASPRGFLDPAEMAKEAYQRIKSPKGRALGADRIFFSGGSPAPSLPYLEKLVEEARKLGDGNVKVNYDTNGFLTEESLRRVLDFTTSVTFDIKAYHDDVHRALTGAPVEPVLRNAKCIAENAPERLWEFRVLLIPKITEGEVKPIAEFLSAIDSEIPLNFLAFRPNFVFEDYQGVTREALDRAVEVAREAGLKNVNWSGRADLPGEIPEATASEYDESGAKRAGGIAKRAGCVTLPRDCGSCQAIHQCPSKGYKPGRRT
ncbi:hypothetical protein AKJ64_00640 [candidate division MSBL1 archaeon SCGC-AAA259E17]|uniref:Radical SAM core domain-containing protein n=1 Tax=candidate division MSBL1 archaeon SCGC-AAA259E17 TaxID=1698263 RepID=A0A133UGV1_9EURY|nr:hypothetical protein AKJ64_00640 [candidate division MSBL1 archaeon SCGC-AAA259E17]